MMRGCKITIDLRELSDVVSSIIRGKRDARQQYFDMSLLEPTEHRIETAPHLGNRLAAQSVVSTELYDDNRWVELENRRQCNGGVLAGGTARATIDDGVRVTKLIEPLLQCDRIRLVCGQTVAGRDAVSETDDEGPPRSEGWRDDQEKEKCSEKASANVHECSVRPQGAARRWRLAR